MSGELVEVLVPMRRHFEAQAVTARANGRQHDERIWLDLLHMLDNAEANLARAVQTHIDAAVAAGVGAALEGAAKAVEEAVWTCVDLTATRSDHLRIAARIVREQVPATGGGS